MIFAISRFKAAAVAVGLVADGVYEFLFVFSPVPYRGATGSPGRPIAIR